MPQPNNNAAAASESVAPPMPPLVGSVEADGLAVADAEAEALAVALALALALALVVALAVAVALAFPPPAASVPESAASKFSPPRSPPVLVSVGAAEAVGANANTAAKHNKTSSDDLFIRPPRKG